MKIVIIGAEAAGASAAAKARRVLKDAEIIIYEKSQITAFGACGLPYFIGRQFDDPCEMISRTPAQFEKNGITVKTGHEVIAIDQRAKSLTIRETATDHIITDHYDKLMIATGAAPVIPPIANLRTGNVFTVKTLEDGLAVRDLAKRDTIRNVVIIGAGFIGLEVAEAMVELNKRTRIIQLDERVLPDLFDPELTSIIEKTLLEAGVMLHLNEMVTALEGTPTVTGVATRKGSYPADLVIIATGVRPSTAFAHNIGLTTLGNGAIVTDEYGQTNLPDIFAAGDCAAVLRRDSGQPAYVPLATVANKLGRIVGENFTAPKKPFPGTLGTAAIKVLDIEAGRTGLSEKEATNLGLPYEKVVIRDKNHSNYVPGQADVTAKLLYHKETRVLLGGQIAGASGSALRINTLAAAIWGKLTVEDLGMLDFLYAPPFARPWDVLNIAGGAAK